MGVTGDCFLFVLQALSPIPPKDVLSGFVSPSVPSWTDDSVRVQQRAPDGVQRGGAAAAGLV